MRPCFKFNAAADATQATLSIYDEIGFWGVQAKDFIKELQGVSAKVLNVEINSPGGDVFAGLAIYNALKGSGKEILVRVMGVAASAASLIAMAGDKISMPKNTFMMVHNPWSFAMGNADDLRESAEVLDKIGASLQATYVARTGQSEDKIKELLSKDTWLTADEALALGFATEVTEDVKAKAYFDMARAELPESVKAMFAKGGEDEPDLDPDNPDGDPKLAEPVAAAIRTAAVAAGLQDTAVFFALNFDSLEKAQARFSEAREITALCALTEKKDKAKGFIVGGKSVADVRVALVTEAAATADDTPINNVRKQAAGGGTGPKHADIWKRHEKATTAARGTK